MVTNESMDHLWLTLNLDALAASRSMDPPLARLAEAALVVLHASVTVLEPFVDSVVRSEVESDTEFEALANKIHIVDYLESEYDFANVLCQGVLYCRRLADRLLTLGISFCVALTADPEAGTVVARFFRRRPGEEWFASDLNAFEEAVALWGLSETSET